jgi:hypothetical protein
VRIEASRQTTARRYAVTALLSRVLAASTLTMRCRQMEPMYVVTIAP